MLNLNLYNQLKTLLSFLASSSVHRWEKVQTIRRFTILVLKEKIIQLNYFQRNATRRGHWKRETNPLLIPGNKPINFSFPYGKLPPLFASQFFKGHYSYEYQVFHKIQLFLEKSECRYSDFCLAKKKQELEKIVR